MSDSKLINIHSHINCSGPELCLINLFAHQSINEKMQSDRIYSIGLHPWHINEDTIRYYKKTIRENLIYPNIFAIGETGLDRAIQVPFDTQIEVFREHIFISEEFDLPVIIHCVKAFNDIINIRKELKPDKPWMLHAYNGNSQITEQLLKFDFYFSFGKSLLNPTNKLLAAIDIIPTERIFLETDEENLEIQNVYSLLAEIKGIKVKDLISTIAGNFAKCFRSRHELS